MSSTPSYDHLDESTYNEPYKPMQQDTEGKSSSEEQPLPPLYSPNGNEQHHQYPPQMQGSPGPNYALPQNDANYGYNQGPVAQNVDYVGTIPQNQLNGIKQRIQDSSPPPYAPNIHGQQQNQPPPMQGFPGPNYALPQNDPNYGYNQGPNQIINNVGTTSQNSVIIIQAPEKPPDYMWLSCFTFWCCCWLLGAIAFFISLSSQSAASDGRIEEARQQGQTALHINIAGIVIGVIAIAVLIGLAASGAIYTHTYH